ncbi:BspA family leucine-rich repeat surface protein [Segatella copri]|uniref:BspA family leucine-rich repeat surface protein n=1 Tax=Segatella copri TaxID=165179 RepID=UPI002617EB29|nr:BspA family leucine-rich repeat surface protein [Segatella copri]WOF98357.1 BspA family leucine-rich repeat surface protein [Segatella copri]
MKRFTNQSNGSQAGRMNYGGAKFCRFALFPLMLLMLLLLPAGMVAQTEASSSKYIATYESSTQTLTFKKNVGETLPKNSAWVVDKKTVDDINNNLGNGTIKHIVFDESFSTYTPTSLDEFFSNLLTLETIKGLEYLNTEKVTDMYRMFYKCSSLTSLDVTHFNTANVTDMRFMFYKCSSLTSLDVTHFNTAKVTNMRYMFYNCKALTSLDVTKFNTEKVTNMNRMFSNCSSLISLNLTKFNTAEVTDMRQMFNECSTLTTIYASDKFVTTNVEKGSNMFSNCINLKGFIDNKNNSDKTDHTYANYKTGYFTKLVGKNGDEKIGAAGETLATDNLTLADDKDFVAYEPFTAKAASYSRPVKAGTTWATLCLPFEVSLADKNFRAFKLLSADNVTETVELEEIETSIEAGTPVIIKMKDGATELKFTEADKEIAKDVQTAETANGNYQLQGLYTQKEFSKDTDNNCYIVKGSKLMNPAKLLDKTTTEHVGSKPFRAYMVDNSSASAPAAGARMFSISVGGSTTAIEQLESTADSKAEYYDLQGRRLQDL